MSISHSMSVSHLTLEFLLLIMVVVALGSFANVVIVRLPKMLLASWRQDCCELLQQDAPAGSTKPEDQQPIASGTKPEFNLLWPNSHCVHCQQQLAWYDNIPILSYLLLRGKCRSCRIAFSRRYFWVEFSSVGLAFLAKYLWPLAGFLPWLIFASWALVLLIQALIDLEHLWLPDELTQPVLWLGLILAAYPEYQLAFLPISLKSAVLGAVAGYISLALFAGLYKLIRGQDGMGQGDFKYFAMLGAWLGWSALPWVLTIAAVLGSIVGLGLLVAAKTRFKLQSALPFIPFLSIGGLIYVILAMKFF